MRNGGPGHGGEQAGGEGEQLWDGQAQVVSARDSAPCPRCFQQPFPLPSSVFGCCLVCAWILGVILSAPAS